MTTRGQAAYEAFVANSGYDLSRWDNTKKWSLQTEGEKKAWEAAVDAAVTSIAGTALKDFIEAVSHQGPLGVEWKDKPHRLIYDLVTHVVYWRDRGLAVLAAYENNVRAVTQHADDRAQAEEALGRAMWSLRVARTEENKMSAGALAASIPRNPHIPRSCRACYQPLRMENLFVDDGCPCNSPRGANFLPVHCKVCKTDNCVKPGHRLKALFGDTTDVQVPTPDAWKDGSDKPLPEDKEIEAVFPTRSHRHDLYNEAVRLVGARFSKYGLVGVVNMLLHRADWGKKLAEKVREYIDAEDQDRVEEFDAMEEALKEAERAYR